MLRFSLKAICVLLVAFAFIATGLGQSTVAADVKWQLLGGKGSEFFFAFPSLASVHASQGYYLGGSRNARIDSLKTMVANVGDDVVQVDLYQGAAKEIQSIIVDRFRDDDGKKIKTDELEKFGFRFIDVRGGGTSYYIRKQFFRKQDRLYVVTAASRTAPGDLIRSFFESIKLVSDNKVMSPNIGDKVEDATTAKLLLPKPFRRHPKVVDPETVTPETEGITPAFIVYRPSIWIPPADSRFDRTFNQVTVKAVLRADGQVGNVELVTKVTKAIEREVIEAARGIKFLPALRHGVAISVVREFQFSLSIS